MFKGNFGFGGGANMQQLMRQAQKMQQDMVQKQEAINKELEETVLTATSAGGMVTLEITGKREIVSLKIKPEAVDPDDVEMLEDLVLSAVNEAIRQADEMYNSEMSKVTGGLGGGLF